MPEDRRRTSRPPSGRKPAGGLGGKPGRQGGTGRQGPPRTGDGRPIRISRNPVSRTGPPPPAIDEWIDEGPVASRRPVQPKRRPTRRSTPTVEAGELSALVGAKRAAVLAGRIGDAAAAFEAERFTEARRILKPIVEEAPASPTARELFGLTLYRLGRYREAASELEKFRQLTANSTEQHPVLADCYRALRRYKMVDELWAELREASPSASLVTEGRIVVAGSLADRGRLADAVRLLEKGWRPPKRPAVHHLRRAYALADLYERAGDLPRARATFSWVVSHDSGLADAADRLVALGS